MTFIPTLLVLLLSIQLGASYYGNRYNRYDNYNRGNRYDRYDRYWSRNSYPSWLSGDVQYNRWGGGSRLVPAPYNYYGPPRSGLPYRGTTTPYAGPLTREHVNNRYYQLGVERAITDYSRGGGLTTYGGVGANLLNYINTNRVAKHQTENLFNRLDRAYYFGK